MPSDPTVIRSKKTPARALPGDTAHSETVESMVRVDHAGEYGAVRIYAGQRAILGESHEKSGLLRHMHEQEKEHLETFNAIINKRGVRPTAMTPVWHVAGFALGAATALMGEKAAMACTAAVEEVIDEHYQEQLDALRSAEAEPELQDVIEKFQAEEVEHREIALKHGAEEAPGYPVLSGLIRLGCRAAIEISKKI